MDQAVVRRDQKRLVDAGTDLATAQRRFGHQIESGAHQIAVDGELRCGRRADDPVLRATVEASAKVISGETGLEADFDPGAVRGERHCARVVTDQRVDVGLGSRDAFVIRGRHQIRSMMVPVDNAPPAHIVISAVLLSVRSSSCSAVVMSRLPVLPTGWPSAIAPPLTFTLSISGL